MIPEMPDDPAIQSAFVLAYEDAKFVDAGYPSRENPTEEVRRLVNLARAREGKPPAFGGSGA